MNDNYGLQIKIKILALFLYFLELFQVKSVRKKILEVNFYIGSNFILTKQILKSTGSSSLPPQKEKNIEGVNNRINYRVGHG